MRLAIRRRSVSSWVSPGPRRPMPPFCRSRWVQPRTRRVDRCDSCASSTCSLPSKLRARCAKMSKINPLRSRTRRLVSFSRLRSWLGLRVWSTSTRSASCCIGAGPDFLGLARADEVLRIGPRPGGEHQARRPRCPRRRPAPGIRPCRADRRGARCRRRPKWRARHPGGVQTTAERRQSLVQVTRSERSSTAREIIRRWPVPSLRRLRRSAGARCAPARRSKWRACRPSD